MTVELFLLVISLLFFASIFTDKLSSKFGVPALLLFLAVGMLFGEDGLGISFDRAETAEAIGTVALCVILFAGGMSTKFREIKPVMAEGVMLASVGVVLTCVITGGLIYLIFRLTVFSEEMSILLALLTAATMSSTDAASVFSILRTNGIQLKNNLRPILELESGSNDPLAYVLTTTLIGMIMAPQEAVWYLVVLRVIWQIVIGSLAGFGFGKFIVWLMRKVRMSNDSLYPLLILTSCIFIFSFTYFLGGNSYLAVYIGGLVIGNCKFLHKRVTMNFFDALSWLCQLTMFLVLGLLVTPHALKDVVVPGLVISIIMIFISRPVSVFLSLIPFRHLHVKDKIFLSWVGLKGAVPIIFAIQCIAAGVPDSDVLFNIAFFCTLVSLVVQGSSLSSIAKKLDLTYEGGEVFEPVHFDIDLPEEVRDQATELCVTASMISQSNLMKDLSLPVGSLVMLLRRGDRYMVPKGHTELQIGDYLLVISENQPALVRQSEQNLWELEMIENTGDFFRTKIHVHD